MLFYDEKCLWNLPNRPLYPIFHHFSDFAIWHSKSVTSSYRGGLVILHVWFIRKPLLYWYTANCLFYQTIHLALAVINFLFSFLTLFSTPWFSLSTPFFSEWTPRSLLVYTPVLLVDTPLLTSQWGVDKETLGCPLGELWCRIREAGCRQRRTGV